MSDANSVVSAFLVAIAKATSKLEEFMRATLKKGVRGVHEVNEIRVIRGLL